MSSSSSKPTLYYMIESTACRLVMLVANGLGIELDLVRVDLFKQEQLKPEFVRINPFHTLPTLVDVDGFTLWESRSIASYLIQTRAPESPLYPTDLKQRITIDKLLNYDIGTLYHAMFEIVYTYFTKSGDPIEKTTRAREKLKTLNEYIATLSPASNFIANTTELTLADLAFYIDLEFVEVVGIDLKNEFPYIENWYKRVSEVVRVKYDPDGAVKKGYEELKTFFEKKILELHAQQ